MGTEQMARPMDIEQLARQTEAAEDYEDLMALAHEVMTLAGIIHARLSSRRARITRLRVGRRSNSPGIR